MKRLALAAGLTLVAALAAAAAVRQDPQEMPKPGKEHELLKSFEGEWDITTTFWMDPGQPPMESKGTESARIGLGGFWLLSEFKGEMMKMPFEGRGVMGYSPMKKKFVGTWVDSMMPHIFAYEGDADAAGKSFTFVADSFDPATGKPVKEKWTMEVKDKDSRSMAFYIPGPDGKERKTGEIRYRRKK